MQNYVNTQYCNSGDKKKRYGVRLTVVQNSQNVTNNTSNITVTFELGGAGALGLSTDYTGSSFNGYTCTGTIYVNGTQKSQGSSSANISNSTKVTLTSWTGNVTHNNDGTLSIPIRGVFTGGLSSQTNGGEASGTVTFDTIPRASSVAVTSTVNIGAKPTFTITSASSSFTHKLYYQFVGISKTLIASGITGSSPITYNNWTIPDTFYAQIPNANSQTCTITCETYSGSSLIGTKTATFTAQVPSTATPTAPTGVTIEDTDNVSKNTIGVYVIGKSKIKFNFPTFHSDYGATLSTYTITWGNNTYSTTEQSYTVNTPVSEASNTYSVTVTDSRGKTASSGNKTFTAYAYSSPNGSINVARDSTTPSTVNIVYSGTVTNVNSNNNNVPSYALQYKKASDTTWSSVPNVSLSGYSVSGTIVQTGVSDSYTYDYKLTVTDSYGSSTYTAQIGTSSTLINFSADGTALAFGKASETANTFECALASSFSSTLNLTNKNNLKLNGTDILQVVYPVGAIYISTQPTSPQTLFGFGTWEAINNKFLLAGSSGTYPYGNIGGSTSYTPAGTVGGHTLTVNEIPSHRHNSAFYNTSWTTNTISGGSVNAAAWGNWSANGGNGYRVADAIGTYTGGGGSHNHGFTGTASTIIPPYLSVYMWKRTA